MFALEAKGVFVERIKFDRKKFAAAYENLSLLMKRQMIIVPRAPEHMAELEIFKSEVKWDGSPEYSSQVAARSAIRALCLVTYDLSPELIKYTTQPSIYFSFDQELI